MILDRRHVPFPLKLHKLLNDAESKGFQSVISWAPGGKAFRIHDATLMPQVLSAYFNQTKYKSFLRQLQNYGFARVHRPGPDKGICTHDLFQRGRPELTLKLKRVPRCQSASVLKGSKPLLVPRTYSAQVRKPARTKIPQKMNTAGTLNSTFCFPEKSLSQPNLVAETQELLASCERVLSSFQKSFGRHEASSVLMPCKEEEGFFEGMRFFLLDPPLTF